MKDEERAVKKMRTNISKLFYSMLPVDTRETSKSFKTMKEAAAVFLLYPHHFGERRRKRRLRLWRREGRKDQDDGGEEEEMVHSK